MKRAYIDHSALEAVAGCEAVCAEDAHRGQEESQDFGRQVKFNHGVSLGVVGNGYIEFIG